MSKLPDDVKLTSDLRAFVEQEMEPYEGEDLERAQNAIHDIAHSRILVGVSQTMCLYWRVSK